MKSSTTSAAVMCSPNSLSLIGNVQTDFPCIEAMDFKASRYAGQDKSVMRTRSDRANKHSAANRIMADDCPKKCEGQSSGWPRKSARPRPRPPTPRQHLRWGKRRRYRTGNDVKPCARNRSRYRLEPSRLTSQPNSCSAKRAPGHIRPSLAVSR